MTFWKYAIALSLAGTCIQLFSGVIIVLLGIPYTFWTAIASVLLGIGVVALLWERPPEKP